MDTTYKGQIALDFSELQSLAHTDQNGWIQVTTDETQMWVEVERK